MADYTTTETYELGKAGDVIITQRPNNSAVKSSKRWLVFSAIMALVQFGVIAAIIMTWVFHFSDAKGMVFLTLFEIGIVVSCIMVLIIFFQYRSWSKDNNLTQTGYNIMVAFIFIELISMVLVLIEFIVRISWKISCGNGPITSDCNVEPQFKVSVVLLTLNGISIFTCLLLIIAALGLYMKMESTSRHVNVTTFKDFISRISNNSNSLDKNANFGNESSQPFLQSASHMQSSPNSNYDHYMKTNNQFHSNSQLTRRG